MSTVILKSVGTGTAVSNCKPLETKIYVIVHEWHSFHDGEVKVNPTPLEKTTKDTSGQMSSEEVMVDTSIEATWLPTGSNRFTAPSIRVGEQVEILQQGDSDIYYWRPWGLDEDKRKLETIIFGISATPSESEDSLDPDNRYWIEFSSHSKKIFLTTSSRNGEYCTYHVGIDTEAGTFQIIDEKQNELHLDSRQDRWFMTTALKCSIELMARDLNVVVPGDFTETVEGNVDIKVGGNFTRKVGGNDSLKIGGSLDYSISGSTVYKSDGGINFDGGGSKLWIQSGEIGWSAPKLNGGQ